MKSIRKLMTKLATGNLGFWTFDPEEEEDGPVGYFGKSARSML
jgi:hypothetical protein